MCKVAFIDDDPMVLRMAAFMMKKSGNQAITASSGDGGIIMIKNERPQIVFIYAEMPVKSGLETLESIRNDAEISSLPVCIMTGTITDELRKKAESFGVVGLIEKPIQASQVLLIINRVTGKG